MGPGNEHKHTVSFHSKYSRISEGEELLRGYNVKTHHKQPKTDAYHRRTRRPTNTILSKPTKNQGSNFLSTTSQNLYALRSTRDSRTRKVISFVLQINNEYMVRYISVENENMERYYRTRILLIIKNGFGRNLWIAKQTNLQNSVTE